MELTPAVPAHSARLAEGIPARVIYDDDDDDDYIDIEVDEDMEEQTQAEGFNQLSLIVASAAQDENQLRSFTDFLNESNVLAFYRPSIGSTPLNNPKTAKIWLHFIHATGPSLSIWERHPINSSVLFGGPVPPAQQGLWTYTMPLKALEYPELLQALLAISSLHIDKLQHTPLTTSSKHYHFALRRLRKALGLPLRRKQIPTLAATLLLAFFEVMAAEHSKWDTHVAGATQLIKEIDFIGMTRDLRAYRRKLRLQRDEMAYSNPWLEYNPMGSGMSDDDPFAEKEAGINEELIGTLISRAVNYDRFGQVEDEGQRLRSSKQHFTRKDIETFRIQCDLYWFYCKHDVFQSMISGNRL
jgi:Fungal specific transcription factor domain